MPIPQIKHGTKVKERTRTKSGRWRKKRSDAGKKRNVKEKSSSTEEKPFKTEDCSGCISIDWSWASNKRGFCSGFVKKPKPKEDVLRFCLLDKDHASVIDLGVDEALTISSILATCASNYIKKRLKRDERK